MDSTVVFPKKASKHDMNLWNLVRSILLIKTIRSHFLMYSKLSTPKTCKNWTMPTFFKFWIYEKSHINKYWTTMKKWDAFYQEFWQSQIYCWKSAYCLVRLYLPLTRLTKGVQTTSFLFTLLETSISDIISHHQAKL